jgi:hypothetical protein
VSDGNIQQRVFDAMPAYPIPINLFALYELVPCDHRSIQSAIANLRALHLVEAVPGTRFTYRRTEQATRPIDRRGGSRRGH